VSDALMELSRAYARAVDRQDPDGFRRVFTTDATLRISAHGDPGHVVRTVRGHRELGRVPQGLERYHRCYHFLGQGSYQVAEDGATGEVYCIAHHLTVGEAEEDVEDVVMYIRYADRYERDVGDARWLIADRLVQVDWTETRAANQPADARPPAGR
jgi:SnoaL-like protein